MHLGMPKAALTAELLQQKLTCHAGHQTLAAAASLCGAITCDAMEHYAGVISTAVPITHLCYCDAVAQVTVCL